MRRHIVPVVVVSFFATAVFADEGHYTERQQQALALLKRGIRQYDLGKFEEAIELLEQAYQEHPWPEILFNLGQAHRQTKTYERALFYYRAYLRNRPDAKNRAEVEDLIVEIEKILADQKNLNARPPPGTTEPASPSPSLDPPVPATETPWYTDTVGWVVAGSGLVCVAAGLGFFANADSLDADASRAGNQSERERLQDLASSRRAWGTGLSIAGAGLLIGGVVKLAISPRPSKSRLTLNVGPNWVGLDWRF